MYGGQKLTESKKEQEAMDMKIKELMKMVASVQDKMTGRRETMGEEEQEGMTKLEGFNKKDMIKPKKGSITRDVFFGSATRRTLS